MWVETDFVTFWWKASHFLPRKSTFSVVWLLVRVRWGQDGVRLMIFIYMLGMVFDHAYIEFEPSRGLRRWFTAVSVWCILSSFSDNHGHNIWIGMKNAESPSPPCQCCFIFGVRLAHLTTLTEGGWEDFKIFSKILKQFFFKLNK